MTTNSANIATAAVTSPTLIVLSPPLQGHRVPLDNQQDSYHLDLASHASFLTNLFPERPSLTIQQVDNQWMVSAKDKQLRVNAEPVYTAIVDHDDIIDYGNMRCRFSLTTKTDTRTPSVSAPDILRNKKRIVALSATITFSAIAAATSYLVSQ